MMSQHQALGELERPTSEAAPARFLNERQCLEVIVGEYTRQRSTVFDTILHLERVHPLQKLKDMTTIGTLLEPAIEALNMAGEPTGHTIGAYMEKTGMDRDDVHDLFCGCRHETITGEDLASHLELYMDCTRSRT